VRACGVCVCLCVCVLLALLCTMMGCMHSLSMRHSHGAPAHGRHNPPFNVIPPFNVVFSSSPAWRTSICLVLTSTYFILLHLVLTASPVLHTFHNCACTWSAHGLSTVCPLVSRSAHCRDPHSVCPHSKLHATCKAFAWSAHN